MKIFEDKDKCIKCRKIIIFRNGKKINYCENCKGNLCDVCNDLHYADNPGHTVVYPKVKLFNQKEDYSSIPELQCKLCDKNLSNKVDSPITFCDNCDGSLCNRCSIRHINEYPTHKSELKMYFPDNQQGMYNIQGYSCMSCGNKLKLMNNGEVEFCKDCKGYLCDKCKNQHNYLNPGHYKKILNTQILEKGNEGFKMPKLVCISCNKNMEDKINKNIDYCGNCNGSLCKDCKKNHNPKHGLRIRKYIFVEPSSKNKDNIPEDEKKKKCIICKKKVIKINDTNYCNQCMGDICDSCNYNHNKDFPGHNLIIRKYLAEKIKIPDDEQSKKVSYNIDDNVDNADNNKNYSYQFPNSKCLSCKEDLSLLDENSNINQCSDCKGNLCLKCSKNHNKTHKLNPIRIKIYKGKINKLGSSCVSCRDKVNNETPYYNCENCQGDLCNKCSYVHYKSKPNHKIYLVRYKYNIPNGDEDKKIKENKEILLNCGMCSKKIEKGRNVYCNNCRDNLCEECYNIHYKKYPNHIIKISKGYYQKEQKDRNEGSKNNCKICNKNLENQNNRYFCSKCQGDLCISCSYNHKNAYPGHSIVIKENNNELGEISDTNRNNLSMNLRMKSKGEHCNSCGISLLNRINVTSFNCDYCDDSFCNKCINSHYKLYPEHKKSEFKSEKKEHHKNVSQENVPSYNITFSSETEEKCDQCQINKPVYYCNQCKFKFCKECKVKHYSKHSSHVIVTYKTTSRVGIRKSIDSRNINIKKIEESINKDINMTEIKDRDNKDKKEEKKEKKINDYSCFMCKIPHSKCPSRIYYTCSDCKNYICSNCKKNHDVKYYSHILANPHKFGEDEKIEDTHRRYASVGARNIKRVKKAQEEKRRCSRLVRLETRKNFCVNCKKTDQKLNMCKKCNKFYCPKCIKNGQHKCF